MCRQRERGQLAAVDVGLDGEEDVVASGVVPVLGGVPIDADPAGHELVGLAGAGERGARVGAHEHDGGPGALGLVAVVGEAPPAEECVVGEELVAVVGGPGGEVELDEQVEGELQRSTRSSSERSGLISMNVLSSRSMIACPSGTWISLSVIGWRRCP